MLPWEKYAQPDQEEGPWSKYGAPTPEQQPSGIMDSLTDAAKVLPGAIATGFSYAAAAPETMANLVKSGIDLGAERLLPEAAAQKYSQVFGTKAEERKRRLEDQWRASGLPVLPSPAETARTISESVPQPTTKVGEYVRTAGELAPAALAPGSATQRIARVLAPAATSETAGQLTKGTAYEPAARLVGALGGSAAASRLTQPRVPLPTEKELKASYKQKLTDPTVQSVRFRPEAATTLSNDIAAELRKNRFHPKDQPQTFRAIKDIAGNTVDDIDIVRGRLGKIAAGSVVSNSTETKAARDAQKLIDDFLADLPNRTAVVRGPSGKFQRVPATTAGDPVAASGILKAGRADYAAGKRTERIAKALNDARINAGSANSGMNVNNATRQTLKPFLKDLKKQYGLSKEEVAQIERTVLGTKTGNVARYVGNLLGGGGGLGQAVVGGSSIAGGIAGYLATGDPKYLALMGLPLAGTAARKVGEASTGRQSRLLDAMVRSRAPLAGNAGRQISQNQQAIGRDALISALLSSRRLSEQLVPE